MKVSQKEMFVLIYLRVFPGVFFFSPINHKLSRIPKGKNMLSTLFLPIIHFQNSFPSGHTKKAKAVIEFLFLKRERAVNIHKKLLTVYGGTVKRWVSRLNANHREKGKTDLMVTINSDFYISTLSKLVARFLQVKPI